MFEDLLLNFGMDAKTALEIQNTKIDDDGEQVTLRHYSLRWLGKAFAAYGVEGCLTDVANLLFAMNGEPPSTKPPPTESEIVRGVEEVVEKLREGKFAELWIPSHMIHDAETDDMLAWLMLKYVHKCMGKEQDFRVLVQVAARLLDSNRTLRHWLYLPTCRTGSFHPSHHRRRCTPRAAAPYGQRGVPRD